MRSLGWIHSKLLKENVENIRERDHRPKRYGEAKSAWRWSNHLFSTHDQASRPGSEKSSYPAPSDQCCLISPCKEINQFLLYIASFSHRSNKILRFMTGCLCSPGLEHAWLGSLIEPRRDAEDNAYEDNLRISRYSKVIYKLNLGQGETYEIKIKN